MQLDEIIHHLPYEDPFLFVDELTEITAEGCSGSYRLNEDAFFYRGHFKNNPITPGVILTEIMAQIGLVCFGIFLLQEEVAQKNIGVAMSSTDIQFYKSVLPGETVTVTSKKEYFRFNKLKCSVRMFNKENTLVAKGVIAGMIIPLHQ